MLKWTLSAVVATSALFMAGCKSDGMDGKHDDHMMHKTAGVDACSHCTGVQTMTADGKCPSCGMAVADACPKCPGIQPMSTMNADGSCPMCAAKMKMK